MNTLKNNPKYATMFAAIATRSTHELKNDFTVLECMPANAERALSKACIFEEIESRIGQDEAGTFLDRDI